ncbi:MAG TPA: efflux RND transporter periplasmic adaptor subunit [Thermodesulfobacterium geofontis]|nr:efflux RND transporter periplasmic adaptor subunit [Thermodesulfobacterium geofontis]
MFKKQFHLIFLSFLILALLSCSKKETKVSSRIQAIPVSVYNVTKPRDVEVKLEYPGRTRSISSVTIFARVTGILEKMYFKEGQFVKKGDLLFLIEQEPYKAEYDSAKANLEKAMAEFKKAERDWKRVKSAFEDKVISEEERDEALYKYETAKANVEYAKARLEQAEINLSYTRVLAPEEGIIGERMVDVGNLVTPGTQLVKITKIDPIYVDFSIPENDLLKVGLKISKIKGLPVEVYIEGLPFKFNGYIDFVDTVVDEKTATVKARAILKNSEKRLLPGQFVRIAIKGLKRKNVIFIPQKAVIQTPTGPAVWVAVNGKAEMRFIKLGESTEDCFIVEEGLRPGDIVIVDNLMKLRSGIPISIENNYRK